MFSLYKFTWETCRNAEIHRTVSFYKSPMRPWGDILGSPSFMQEALKVIFFANLLESFMEYRGFRWTCLALELRLSLLLSS